MVEETELVSYSEDDEELEVRTLMQTTPGENVRAPGSDVRKGDLVIQAGSVILGTGGDVGTLGFVGRREVGCFQIMYWLCLIFVGQSISQACCRDHEYRKRTYRLEKSRFPASCWRMEWGLGHKQTIITNCA